MHYPVMTEKHLADRWQVSLKTLQRWRFDGEGPVWHKLFRHVRYHEADVLEFERRGAQHLMALLGINREFISLSKKPMSQQNRPHRPSAGTSWSGSKTENGSIPRRSLNRCPLF